MGKKPVSIFHESSQTFLAMRVTSAMTFWKRLLGWMGKRTVRDGEALLLSPCSRIHTCFMKIPIDVLFLDRDSRVVGVLERVKPFQFPPSFRRACMVVELPEGTIARKGVQVFDQLRIVARREEGRQEDSKQS
ncbi:DUF192 domain-containing protein [Brevibacillus migulae]|uniref:DUF192 domain-containing protein n=1 Tax=Brevibacillus migulae TaxID=1644114 RepID=UPI00142F5B67|nr:DUF192 domain-containing protein [Brevibacillus migulae]